MKIRILYRVTNQLCAYAYAYNYSNEKKYYKSFDVWLREHDINLKKKILTATKNERKT